MYVEISIACTIVHIKKEKGGCFLNNFSMEIAIGLRFSPFDREGHSTSSYR